MSRVLSRRILPRLALSAGFVAGPTAAWGATLDDAVSSARAALQDGNEKRAVAELRDAEALAAAAPGIVHQARLGEALLLRGAALHRRGGRSAARGMDAWRAALVVAPDLEWDTGLLGEGDDWSLFLALRGEVSSRQRVDVGVPAATGAATVHVDGVQMHAGDKVVSGNHLGQITCDDGTVHGIWTTLMPPPDWLALCPGGVDTTVVVAAPAEDDWGDMAPAFGTPVAAVDGGSPEPDAGDGPTEPVAADGPAEPGSSAEPGVPTPAPGSANGSSAGSAASARGRAPFTTPQMALLGAGSALMAGGTVLYFTAVVPSVDAAVAAAADPAGISRQAADDLTAKARRSQGLTLASLGGGAALAAGGLAWGLLLDAPVRPMIAPGHLGLHGRF
ncbi:MAG: hypothetical protein VX265_12695 [Myxococcota bacterium]|nr:hypothetical protein [Myxococcota bacterium]